MRATLSVFALWAAGLAAAAQYGKMSVLFDSFDKIYPGQSPVALGMIVSVVGMVGLIFGTTAGLLVARIGPRRAMVAALLLGAAMTGLQGLGLSYPLMILSRVLEGVSHLAIVVVAPTVMAGLANDRYRPLVMILWSSFFGLTYAVLAVAAPPLMAAYGAAGLYGAHMIWMLIVALVIWLLLPVDPPAPPRGKQSVLVAHLEIYASPSIAAPALGFFSYTFLYVALLTLLPAALPLDLLPQWRAIAAGGMPLLSILMSMSLGVWLMSHRPAVWVVQMSYLALIPGFLLLGLAWGNGPAMVLAGLICTGGLGIVQAASFAAIPELNPGLPERVRAAGAIAQMGNLGTTIGTPMLAAVLATAGGWGMASVAIIICLYGAGMHLVQAKRRLRRG